MTLKCFLDAPTTESIPIRAVRKAELVQWLDSEPPSVKRWSETTKFEAEPGKHRLIPTTEGVIGKVVLGLDEASSPWDWAALPVELPPHSYHLESELSTKDADAAALGFALGSYGFDRLRQRPERDTPRLSWPKESRRTRVEAAARATFLVRDLVNTPTSHLGPAELAEAAEAVAKEHDGKFRVVVGDDLLKENYPSVHAVGRAAAPDRAPRLIDVTFGDTEHPKVTLVGKGVCFDSGGLDLKSAANMKLMKKDMGGAAHVLGLATMIRATGLPVRLRVLIPAVENSVSGSALRPLDVVKSRKGTTIEIGNTDAEGRVILSDALAEGGSENPALLVDFATLTGAAKVALGADLPALFCNDDDLASGLLAGAETESDPLWRMPLFKPYRKLIESKVADIVNSTDSPFGGAITAALFLEEFVPSSVPWAHLDIMAWNQSARSGRPEGGEAMGMRAVFALIEDRFAPA